jgi:hypothetical protein
MTCVLDMRELAGEAAQDATECSRRGDVEGSFYARGLRDGYLVPRQATFARIEMARSSSSLECRLRQAM